MDQVCLVLPVREGKSTAARDFMRELDTDRKGDYAVSERRIGIDKEAWYWRARRRGISCRVYGAPDFGRALATSSESRMPLTYGSSDQLDESTGLDLNHPPSGMTLPGCPELYRRVIDRGARGPAARASTLTGPRTGDAGCKLKLWSSEGVDRGAVVVPRLMPGG